MSRVCPMAAPGEPPCVRAGCAVTCQHVAYVGDDHLESPRAMTDLPEHSKFSASRFSRIMACPGSLALEDALPETTSSYADEGSAAHWVASEVLEGRLTLEGAVGQVWIPKFGPNKVPITESMVEHVQTYIDTVRTYGGELLVEQRVRYGDWLGVSDDEAFGTSDAVILEDERITIVDLKFGMGVRVFAENNPQLMLYALGALYEYEMLGDFKRARMVISQPRLGHLDEWECDVRDLMKFALEAREAVKAARVKDAPLNPHEYDCRFCKAKATCPALAAEVRAAVTPSPAVTPEDFDDLTTTAIPHDDVRLGVAMSKVELVEHWCKAIRAEVERRLFAGQDVPGFKLVEGKRGNRAWSDAAEVEAKLKAMRLRHEEMFSYSLKGPKPMEDLLKKESPRRWAALQEYITQSEGKPSVAPASDGRPALSIIPTADEFDDLSETVGASGHPFRS